MRKSNLFKKGILLSALLIIIPSLAISQIDCRALKELEEAKKTEIVTSMWGNCGRAISTPKKSGYLIVYIWADGVYQSKNKRLLFDAFNELNPNWIHCINIYREAEELHAITKTKKEAGIVVTLKSFSELDEDSFFSATKWFKAYLKPACLP